MQTFSCASLMFIVCYIYVEIKDLIFEASPGKKPVNLYGGKLA